MTAPPGERLSKRVATLVPCSRSDAEKYIEGGWVLVDNQVVEQPQHRVTALQKIALDPHASLIALPDVTLVVHKPANTGDGCTGVPRPGGRQRLPIDIRTTIHAASHWTQDASGVRLLQRHLLKLQGAVPLETGASGLVVFSHDWRVQRKLAEDAAFMEHEYIAEVPGEVLADRLDPILHALRNPRQRLPATKVSISSSTPARSQLRFAIKGSHPGLVAYLCELAGLEIRTMRRTRLGRVALRDLPAGQWRYLAPTEKF